MISKRRLIEIMENTLMGALDVAADRILAALKDVPTDNGLREEYENLRHICEEFVYKCEHGMARSSKTYGKMKAALSRHPATEEPVKDCGFTLKTCPYERSSGITMRKPEEPLAVLADRKGFWMNINHHGGIWRIYGNKLDTVHITLSEWSFECATYPEAESKARAYLNTLPDREDK